MNGTRVAQVVFLLFLTLTLTFFSSFPPLIGSSEAREAHVIRSMYESGNYILPSRNGIIPSKPPLFHWLGVGFSRTFNEFSPQTARLPSIFATALIVYALMQIMNLVPFKLRGSNSGSAGDLAALLLLTTYGFTSVAITSLVDTVFSACVFFSVLPFLRASIEGRDSIGEFGTPIRAEHLRIFHLWCGLAVLAKGPLGLLLPWLLALCLCTGQFGLVRTLKLFCRPRFSWAFFALLALPWYGFAALQGSEGFIGRQIIFENLKRFTGGEFITQKPWWYYLTAYLRSGLPWSIAFPFVLYSLIRQPLTDYRIRVARGLLWGVLVAVFFFSSAQGKRDSYLLPLYPFLVCASLLWASVQFEKFSDRARGLIVRCASVFSVVVLIYALFFTAIIEIVRILPLSGNALFDLGIQWIRERAWLYHFGVGGVLLLYFAGSMYARKLNFNSVQLTGLLTVTLLVATLAVGNTLKGGYKNFSEDAAVFRKIAEGQKLSVVRGPREEFFDAVQYYLNRPLRLVSPESSIDCDGYFLSKESWLQQYRNTHPSVQFQEVARRDELDDKILRKSDRVKVLFTCRLS